MSTPIRTFLEKNRLLFDGAFGTYYQALGKVDADESCELGNLTHPELVQRIHKEYIAAGCNAVKTNTFGAYPPLLGDAVKQQEVVHEAVQNVYRGALQTEGEGNLTEDFYVFGDLGQAPGDTEEEVGENYISLLRLLLQEEVHGFLFETMTNTTGLKMALEFLRRERPDAFVILSFGVFSDGYTSEGRYYRDLIREAREELHADVVGMNCVSSAPHLVSLVEKLSLLERENLSILPNAGYPVVRGFRTIFEGNAEIYVDAMAKMAESGVRVLGGCCGTTPAYTKKMRSMLDALPGVEETAAALEEAGQKSGGKNQNSDRTEKSAPRNRLLTAMEEGHQVIAVELDSPLGCDTTKFMAGAKELKEAGVNCITIADNPIARARMDSTVLAAKVIRELDLDVIPHMTCRDRNVNATRSLLLGGYAEGVRNVLLVTGDPIPSAQRDEVQKVYQFNSRKLIHYVNSLNEELFQEEPMAIYGALNVNARNFHIELSRAVQKQEEGAIGFLTQPAMTEEAIQNLAQARENLGDKAKIFGGIIPVISEKNGRFMESEISGIHISEEMIESYHGLDREASETLAEKYSVELAEKILPYVDGIYLMTPFGRTGLMSRIVENIKPLMR